MWLTTYIGRLQTSLVNSPVRFKPSYAVLNRNSTAI